MKRRSKAEWLSLIEEFEQSDLTQVRFCAERGLNPKYFSLRRAKLKAVEQQKPFIEAFAAEASSASEVTIQYGRVAIRCPASSPQAIAQLVKAVAWMPKSGPPRRPCREGFRNAFPPRPQWLL